MKLIGLDPGTTHSAIAVYDTVLRRVDESNIDTNEFLCQWMSGLLPTSYIGSVLVIEKIESMGMAVGAEVFETVFWSGRFYQAWPRRVERVSRRDVKLHLCGSMRAKDANVRQALIDKLGAPGIKKSPGPTYGVSSHQWAALAVAVTWHETQGVSR